MNEFRITYAVVAVAVFLITVAAEHFLIPILRSHKLGQKILDIGPRWHKSKEGTPIMGGIGFALGVLGTIAMDRHIAKNRKTVYTITGYAPGQGAGRKGDNEFG